MPSAWSTTSARPNFQTTDQRDATIATTASRQKQLIRAEQLAALGLAASTISDRVRRGRLHRVRRGVYALHPPPGGG